MKIALVFLSGLGAFKGTSARGFMRHVLLCVQASPFYLLVARQSWLGAQ